jgi:hypothetical protein
MGFRLLAVEASGDVAEPAAAVADVLPDPTRR